MRSIIAWVVLTIALSSNLFAQPDSLWSRTYGGHVADWCNDFVQVANGYYAMAGYTASFGAGSNDFWLVITNNSGDSLWSHSYGGSNIDECNSLIQTEDGGFALAGATHSFGAGWTDFWLVKTAGEGDSLWSRTYGGRFDESCNQIIQTADGGLVLAGRTSTFDAGWQDMWIIKIDQNGDSLWAQRYGGSDLDECMSIQQTTDGGFILAGWTDSYGAGLYDFWLVKTNEIGDSLWSRTFGGSNREICYDVKQTSDGGFLLAGKTNSFGAGNDDFYLVKTDENGNSLWSRTYGGEGYEICYSVLETSEGGHLLAGTTSSFGVGTYDSWLLRVNSAGDSLWSMTFGGSQSETCFSVLNPDYSGYALAGYSFSSENGDFWLARTGFDPTPAPPISFSRLLPVDSTIQRISPLELSWEPSLDPNGTEVNYRLLIESTHPDFVSLDTIIDEPEFELELPMLVESNLDEIFDVHWNVFAISEGDTIEASDSEGMFYIDTPEPPSAFERVLPEDNSFLEWTVMNPTITFSWTRSLDPNGDEVSYSFHLETPSIWGVFFPEDTVTHDTTVTVEVIAYAEPLDDIVDFYWTVYAQANLDTVEASNGDGHFQLDFHGVANEDAELPTKYSLSLYPNPFNPSTTIHYDVPQQTHITIFIYDLLGREIAQLMNETVTAGSHSLNWNCPSCATGLYLIELKSESYHQITKAMLLR